MYFNFQKYKAVHHFSLLKVEKVVGQDKPYNERLISTTLKI
ncbi:hypothetical protein SPPR111872_11825 [Sphingobacterium prati]